MPAGVWKPGWRSVRVSRVSGVAVVALTIEYGASGCVEEFPDRIERRSNAGLFTLSHECKELRVT